MLTEIINEKKILGIFLSYNLNRHWTVHQSTCVKFITNGCQDANLNVKKKEKEKYQSFSFIECRRKPYYNISLGASYARFSNVKA